VVSLLFTRFIFSIVKNVFFLYAGVTMYKKIIFYVLKLPTIYTLIISGFIFEFFISLPFLVLCAIDNIFDKKQ